VAKSRGLVLSVATLLWGCGKGGPAPTSATPPTTTTTLPPVITLRGDVTDPVGDARAFPFVPVPPDLVSASVQITAGNVALFSVRFASGSSIPSSTLATFVLDIDQDPRTGPCQDPLTWSPCRDLGTDYAVTMGSSFLGQQARIDRFTGGSGTGFEFAGSAPVTYAVDGINASVSLSLIGGREGRMNFRVFCQSQIQVGAYSSATDAMPDANRPPGSVQ